MSIHNKNIAVKAGKEVNMSMGKINAVTVVLLALWTLCAHTAYANDYSWIADERTQAFVREFGFPTLIALGLFGLFGWFLGMVSKRFFTSIEKAEASREAASIRLSNLLEASDAERKETTERLMTVLSTTIQDTNAVMIKSVAALDAMQIAVMESTKMCSADRAKIVHKLDKLHTKATKAA